MTPKASAVWPGDSRTKRALSDLRNDLQGTVLTDGDPGYEDDRVVWNGMIDKYPAAIARCASSADVATAIAFARSRSLPIAVRSGGHNVAGRSVIDGGLVVDVSQMKKSRIDADARVAHVGSGLTIAEFDRETQAHGLATPMGLVGSTGIAGLTLGGGFGKLARKHGLACDNLLQVEIVTASGHRLRASAKEKPDLFWALRGGGGNFGVVTSFAFRLHPVGPEVLAGTLLYDMEKGREVLPCAYRLARAAPDELCIDMALVMPEAGKPMLAISPFFHGDIEEGERQIQPFRDLAKPLQDSITRMTYLDVQAGGDQTFPPGRRYYWKAQFLDDPPDEAFDALLHVFSKAPSTGCLAVLQHVGGAIARVPPDATAYVNRDAAFDVFPVAIWDRPEEDAPHLDWARALWSALQPFSTGGVYANNLGDEGEHRVKAAYGRNYPRLAKIKRRYDPENLFRGNQNVRAVGVGQ